MKKLRGKYRRNVVLGRSAATLPAWPFLAALSNDPSTLGLLEFVPDADGTYRRVPNRYTTATGNVAPSFASAVLRRAQAPVMPPTVMLAPRRHLEFPPML